MHLKIDEESSVSNIFLSSEVPRTPENMKNIDAMSWEGRVLVVDSYDSYIFNICCLIEKALPKAKIFVIRNNQLDMETLIPQLSAFDWCVLGPGPGSPICSADIGILPAIWALPDTQLLPTLGICLGMQTMCLHFGGRLQRLIHPAHGIITAIDLIPDPLFGKHKKKQYKSNSHCLNKDQQQRNVLDDLYSDPDDLCSDLEDIGDISNNTQEQEIPNNTKSQNELKKLTVVRYHSFSVNIDGIHELKALAWANDTDGPVLMAARHRQKPFYGMQYHPESLFSMQGKSLILNFWRIAIAFNRKHRPHRTPLSNDWYYLDQKPVPLLASDKMHNKTKMTEQVEEKHFQVLQLDISAVEIAEYLQLNKLPYNAIMESTAKPGKFSILGVPSDGHYALTYTYPDRYLVKTYSDREEKITLETINAWNWISNELYKWKADYKQTVPFCGGFIGYFSYEYCVYTANIRNKTRKANDTTEKTEPVNTDYITCNKIQNKQPDVNLLFYERSIVIDTVTKKVIVQSLIYNDPWVVETAAFLKKIAKNNVHNSIHNTTISTKLSSSKNNSHNETSNIQTSSIQDLAQNSCSNSIQDLSQNSTHITQIIFPNKKEYFEKIKAAQDYISNGESYELCLTSTARIISSKSCTPANDWGLYKRLRTLNPAPYAGYLRLNNVTLLSSSPERFLSWSRDGLCELRPIKGTIRKDSSIDLEKAKVLLKTPKLYAENLMILDLIRNDLYQIANDIHVPMPMQVEEYQTLYQLVSVVQGTVRPPYTGIDMLAHALPPGSMTGAPKKRSVELLNKLEKNKRNIYSGVFGYFSVSGEGDWSVIIRSAFRYHNENHWSIGAGGAITTLSNSEDEWDEMILKLQSVLPIFTNEPETKIT
ncbi:aminodeoxychorismate synthase [Pneumocystis jirovecii RU7]|uniref:aminodeoxychorismate synthase n=1 Tax=Pneumocystis jirovecii (strain RU7) TaxID=1408657 RepID=A0A0W4ZDR1_PNEJ7|nr:aminodeoxychorismate synthase [Pneumocystis jirovecii RU7]KTW26521.1 aminodeoxychorismate synthase [Pneumocystis jirovecii RU7]